MLACLQLVSPHCLPIWSSDLENLCFVQFNFNLFFSPFLPPVKHLLRISNPLQLRTAYIDIVGFSLHIDDSPSQTLHVDLKRFNVDDKEHERQFCSVLANNPAKLNRTFLFGSWKRSSTCLKRQSQTRPEDRLKGVYVISFKIPGAGPLMWCWFPL